MDKSTAKLYLIPNTLGHNTPSDVMSKSVGKIIASIDYFVFEKEKIGRSYVKSWCPNKSQDKLNVFTLNKHTSQQDLIRILDPCMAGHDMAIISDAGCPGLADPGADLVLLAHQSQIEVCPLVGPSSILLALMASGLNGQQFAFHGYLPIDKQDCKKAIKKYERLSLQNNQTQIFIETPYRNMRCFEMLIEQLSPHTLLSVACDLNLSTEIIRTKAISEWTKGELDLHKRPCIFLYIQPNA